MKNWSLNDEKNVSVLTTNQNACIRIHKDLLTCVSSINEIPVDDYSEERGLSLASPECPIIGINGTLKERLISECQVMIPQIEKIGGNLSEFTNSTSSLWVAYFLESKEKLKKKTALPPPQVEIKHVEESSHSSPENDSIEVEKKKKTPQKSNLKKKELTIDTQPIVKNTIISSPSVSWSTGSIIQPSVSSSREFENQFPSLSGKKKKKEKDSQPKKENFDDENEEEEEKEEIKTKQFSSSSFENNFSNLSNLWDPTFSNSFSSVIFKDF
jgi:hypothetical protein